MSHTKHTINTETERNPIFRNDSQLCEYETLFSIIEGFRQQKVGSCQVSLPLCLCAMLAHSGGLSVSSLQDWFMASISMFMRCHRPATKKKKEKKSFFHCYSARMGVAMQHWGTDRQRMELHRPVAKTAQLTFPKVATFRWVRHHVFTQSNNKIYWEAVKERYMLSHCYNLWASVQTCKTNPFSSWLLDHLLQDSKTLWINE